MFSNLRSLHILFTLDQALPQTSQEMSENIETQLQSILVALLNRSHVSGIHRLKLYNEVLVLFVSFFIIWDFFNDLTNKMMAILM